MSSSSFVDILEEDRSEFPFPTIENGHPRSPSDSGASDLTPPYLARSLPDHPPSSSAGSSSRRHRTHRHEREHRDRHGDREQSRDDDSTPAKLLSRLAARSESKHIRTLLVLTNDKLEAETRRADQAEQRVVDVLHRLRAANEATAIAQAETSRAQQAVRLYTIQLEAAQREISRAQDIVDQVERLRREAEEEAAKARSVARKCREEVVLSRAREEGRQQGYLEGLERGRRLGFTEASTSKLARRAPSRPPPRAEESDDMEIDVDEPSPPPRRRVDSERRPDSVPSVQRAPSPPRVERYPTPRAPSRVSRRRTPDHIPDFAPIGAGIPVPTLTTPVNPPSPSHSRPQSRPRPPPSPQPLPVPEPKPRSPPDIRPIPLHNPPRSPMHPHVDIPPDNYIPYARDNDTNSIVLPPPHEFSRPVSPVSPPSPSPAPLAPPPPPPVMVMTGGSGGSGSLGSRETIIPIAASPRIYQSELNATRSKDYAYPTMGGGGGRSGRLLQPPGVASPQSRTSTRISEYDILGRPGVDVYRQNRDEERRIYAEPRRERTTTTAYRAPPSRGSEYTLEAGAGPQDEHEDLSRPIYVRHPSSQSSIGPFNRLFRRKSKGGKRSMSPGPSRHGEGEQDSSYPVPDITVESPSTDNSRPSSVGTGTATVPHLLSPEHAHTALPALAEMFGFPSPLDQQPSRPHSTQSQGREWSQQTTPLHYAEAPVPPNVVYPEVPRTKSRAENRSLSSSDGESGYENSFKSVAKRQQQVQQRDSLSTGGGSGAGAGGRLSPLSLFK